MKLIMLNLIAISLAAAAPPPVWVEAESASKKSIQTNGWYSDVKKDELSGGGFLAHWGNQPGTASYDLNITESGSYILWLRANPVGSKLEFKIDQGTWMVADFKNQSHESINIASNNKPDLRFVSWVRGGLKNLTAGKHLLEVRFNSSNNHHGNLDCFCFTTDPDWKPRGTLKPNEKLPHWPAPEISTENLDTWISFIRPSAEELGWRSVRWHRSLSEAAEEARKLDRPILLWAMNGHPCGET